MALSRVVAGLTVVAAGIATALAAGALPAIGHPPAPLSATPSSPGQRLVCPGSLLSVGASATASLAAVGSPVRSSGTAGGDPVTAMRLGAGTVTGSAKASPRLLSAAPQAKAGPIAGAQLQTIGSGDAQGFAAAACTVPTATSWFAAGATSTGRTTVLLVADPAPVDAQIAVRVWTEQGAVGSGASYVIPAHGRIAVPVSSLAPDAASVVVEVVSTGGRIAAAVEQQTVRGLESGGLDIAGPTLAPAVRSIVTGVRVRNAPAVAQASAEQGYGDLMPALRVLAPGGAGGTVRIRAVAADGSTAPTVSRAIAGGSVSDFTLAGLTDGTWTITVDSDVPVVAGVRVSTIDAAGQATSGAAALSADLGGTARHLDLAWFAAAPVLGAATAATAVGSGVPAELTLANPTGGTITAAVAGSTSGGVRVQSGATAVLAVAPGVLRLTGASGLVAAIDYAGRGALGGYPVTAADQTSRTVRVSH